jgi:hypothetical protein
MRQIRRYRRVPLLLTAVSALAGCGTATMVAAPYVAGAPSPARTPVPTSRPTPAAAAPSDPPPQTPQAASQPAASTFAINPLFAGGAAGTVSAATSSSNVQLDIVVTGLVAHSVHTIHDHAGRCDAANRSPHLAVLATAAADAGGVITVHATVPPSEFGAGRIVIVYDTARPLLITGCAEL